MFRSKSRAVVFPQAEHARLSGSIAFLWGNSQFAPFPSPVESYVAGITYHDRGYGLLDDGGIGEIGEEDWLEYQLRGAETGFSDPTAEALVRLHLRRLLRYHETPPRVQAAEKIEAALARFVTRHQLDRALLERADRITRLCDNIAFDFCFELDASGTVEVPLSFDSDMLQTIAYEVRAGTITLRPWPLSVAEYRGFICGYRGEEYPAALDPVITPFRLVPGT